MLSGARVPGARGDVVIAVDDAEHRRRVAAGLGGVVDLGLLDALMSLPPGAGVPGHELGDVAGWHLRRAPKGCVHWSEDGSVTRLLARVCEVDLVIVRSGSWRAGLRRAAEFVPYARSTVVLAGGAPEGAAWEADVAGVGLRVLRDDGASCDLVAPAPFVPRYLKPSAWAFAERAYAAWRSSHRSGQAPDGEVRRP